MTNTGAGHKGHARFVAALHERAAHLPPLALETLPFELRGWPKAMDGLRPPEAGKLAALLPACAPDKISEAKQ